MFSIFLKAFNEGAILIVSRSEFQSYELLSLSAHVHKAKDIWASASTSLSYVRVPHEPAHEIMVLIT